MAKTITIGISLILFVNLSSCTNQPSKSVSHSEEKVLNTPFPEADKWVSSPLRNLIKLELNASLTEVWSLIGDPGKMPSYSSGLEKVETKISPEGRCLEYTCFFKAEDGGQQGSVHTAKMLWYEPNRGWASLDEEPNEFGFKESLTLITFEARGDKTIVKWSMHFNCESQELLLSSISSLEEALEDISKRLIKIFGGVKLEGYAEGK